MQNAVNVSDMVWKKRQYNEEEKSAKKSIIMMRLIVTDSLVEDVFRCIA